MNGVYSDVPQTGAVHSADRVSVDQVEQARQHFAAHGFVVALGEVVGGRLVFELVRFAESEEVWRQLFFGRFGREERLDVLLGLAQRRVRFRDAGAEVVARFEGVGVHDVVLRVRGDPASAVFAVAVFAFVEAEVFVVEDALVVVEEGAVDGEQEREEAGGDLVLGERRVRGSRACCRT